MKPISRKFPEEVRKDLEIIPAISISDVLNAALEKEPSDSARAKVIRFNRRETPTVV